MGKYPDFECQNLAGDEWQACSHDTVCDSHDNNFQYRYNWNSDNTISNWITSMKLECEPGYKIGMIGSLYFLGFCIGAATLLRLADIKGRRPMLIFSMVSSTLVTFCFLITNSLTIAYILTFLNGMFLAVRIAVGYMCILEFAPLSLK